MGGGGGLTPGVRGKVPPFCADVVLVGGGGGGPPCRGGWLGGGGG